MKNITTNKTIDNKNIVENKISLSLREFSKKRILFRLVNTKRNNTKSFNIYEKAKLSTNRLTFLNLLFLVVSYSISIFL